MGDYRKLEVYKLACEFSDRVARAVERLPAKFADKADQLRRAADSTHEAISEGCGLNSDPQLLKYLRYALGSANECEDELHTLNRRNLLAETDLDLLDMVRRLSAKLASFAARVESDIARDARGLRKGSVKRRPSGKRKADSKQPRAEGRQQASREPRADAESRGPQPSG